MMTQKEAEGVPEGLWWPYCELGSPNRFAHDDSLSFSLQSRLQLFLIGSRHHHQDHYCCHHHPSDPSTVITRALVAAITLHLIT